jgi:phosphocarrier protein
MKTFTYTIKDSAGIHARPAGNLVKLAKGFTGTKIMIEKGGKSVDVTKLMMLMGLGVKCGDTVTFTVEGGDEEAAAKAVEDFMTANL